MYSFCDFKSSSRRSYRDLLFDGNARLYIETFFFAVLDFKKNVYICHYSYGKSWRRLLRELSNGFTGLKFK